MDTRNFTEFYWVIFPYEILFIWNIFHFVNIFLRVRLHVQLAQRFGIEWIAL